MFEFRQELKRPYLFKGEIDCVTDEDETQRDRDHDSVGVEFIGNRFLVGRD